MADRWSILRLAAALAALPGAAAAQRAEDRMWVQVGAFFPTIDSRLRIDSAAAARGTRIDLEDTIRLDRNATVVSALAGGRFARRWQVEGEYLAVNRTARAIIDRDIIVGETVYPLGAQVEGELESDIYRLSVGWSAVAAKRTRVNLSLGFHVTDFRARFEGQGSVNGGPPLFVTERRTLLAPLPTIGIYATHSLTKQLSLAARGDVFSLKVGDYDGTLVNARAGLDWRFTKHVGIGGGYRLVSYDIGVRGEDLSGRVDYRLHGPYVSLVAGF